MENAPTSQKKSQTEKARAETKRRSYHIGDAEEEDGNGKFKGKGGTELVAFQAGSNRAGSLHSPSAHGKEAVNIVDSRLLFSKTQQVSGQCY